MKHLLFVIDSLGCGGAEKSLVSLLSHIDYSEYRVDVITFAEGGLNGRFLPPEVNLLDIPDIFKYLRQPFFKQLKSPRRFLARARYSLEIRFGNKSHLQKACVFWRLFGKFIPLIPYKYHTAIAYAHGVPTFFVAEKVIANHGFAWVNAILQPKSSLLDFLQEKYNVFNKIVCVSEAAQEAFGKSFPALTDNLTVIRDIISAPLINKLSVIENDSVKLAGDYIVTVSRLADGHKGMDILLQVANELKNRGVQFKWVIVGGGPYQKTMRKLISDNNLKNHIVMTGALSNPYPTVKKAMLYVQTSRYEGYGLAIAEARLLNIPVVTTAYEGWEMQMIPGKNGIVCPVDANAVADAVQDMLLHPEKREAISAFQRTEQKGNPEEMEKFYKLIES